MICRLIPFLILLIIGRLTAQDSLTVSEVGRIFRSWDNTQAVAVREDIIFLATGTTGLLVVDASDFDNISIIGELHQLNSTVYHLVVDGDLLFAVDSTEGVTIINIARPDSMYETGFIEAENRACDVAVSGHYAYLGDGEAGLRVFNISDPSDPDFISSYDAPGDVSGVVVRGR